MRKVRCFDKVILSFLFVGLNALLCAQNLQQENAVLVPGTKQLYTTSHDEPSKMMRAPAVCACAAKGDGWRLPTVEELQIMFSHRYEMDFGEGVYWSGEKVQGDFKFYVVDFKNGKALTKPHERDFFVRCVWSPTNN